VQRSGDKVEITVQLIQAPTDRHLLAKSYERGLRDVLALQRDIARAITDEIKAKLTPGERATLASSHPVNPEAYEAYLEGRYFWNKRTENAVRTAAEYFQRAVDKDPTYARAYAGLADAYSVLGSWSLDALPPSEVLPKARAAVTKALQLDDSIAEAHTALAGIKSSYDWDWQGASIEFRRAIELNPSYATSHQWYSQYLTQLGRFDEGIAEAAKAHSIDPLSLIVGAEIGCRLYWARRYDDAIEPIQKALELDPNFPVAHRYLGQVYEQKGMYKEAVAEFARAVALSESNPISLAALGHAYAVSGQRSKAIMVLKQLKELSKRRYVSSYDMALIYAGLGETDQAQEWLERAYRDRSPWMVHLKVDPRLDPLRSDPRFQDLIRRVGLPQ